MTSGQVSIQTGFTQIPYHFMGWNRSGTYPNFGGIEGLVGTSLMKVIGA